MATLKRVSLGAFAGIVIGFLIAIIAVSVYHQVARSWDLHDTAVLEAVEGRIFLWTFIGSAILIGAISTLAGNVEIRSPYKQIAWGAIVGLILACSVSWGFAYLTWQNYGGKFPVELFFIGLAVTTPVICTISAWMRFKTHYTRHESEHDHQSDSLRQALNELRHV